MLICYLMLMMKMQTITYQLRVQERWPTWKLASVPKHKWFSIDSLWGRRNNSLLVATKLRVQNLRIACYQDKISLPPRASKTITCI